MCPRGCRFPFECLEKFTGRVYENCHLRQAHATPDRAAKGREDECFGVIREAIKASKNAARRRGSNVTYYEQAKAVMLALREAGFDV